MTLRRTRDRIRTGLRLVAPRLRGLLGIYKPVQVRFVHLGGPAQVSDDGVIEFDAAVCARFPWPVVVGIVVQEVFHVLRGDHLLWERDRRRRAKLEADHLTGRVLAVMRLPLRPMEQFLLTWCPVGDDDEHLPGGARVAVLRQGAAMPLATLRALR